MATKILILSGSPKKNGNTETLINWFIEGAHNTTTQIEVVHTSFLKYRYPGCSSCRSCQKTEKYGCVIDDDASTVIEKMIHAQIIVMATPLYFFSASAQLKIIFDRMFSLYKWDNDKGTMQTVLQGKTFALIASAFENIGLDALEKPFSLTADYSGMRFESLLIPDAGISGEIKNNACIRERAIEFGKSII